MTARLLYGSGKSGKSCVRRVKMSIASRVLPCSVRITAFRKRACGSRGLAASALFTRSSASRCWPAFRNLVASWSSSARAVPRPKSAQPSRTTSETTPRLRIEYGAVIVCIVLYFSRPYERFCILDQPPRLHNLPGMLSIHNSLGRTKQEFVPLRPGEARMYVCGMTVYDYCHLGHARVLVVFDIVRRWLRESGYRVTYVRNITDIDDKIIRRAHENKEPVEALTARFIRYMDEDAAALGV